MWLGQRISFGLLPLLLGISLPLRGAPEVRVGGHESAAVAGDRAGQGPRPSASCGPFDPDCRQKLLQVRTFRWGTPRVDAGAGWGRDGASGVIRFEVEGAGAEVPVGEARALVFSAEAGVNREGMHGVRIRFRLYDSEAVFFCRNPDTGRRSLPYLSLKDALYGGCEEEEAWGIGLGIFDGEHDLETGRTAVRWGEARAVLNFLSNGNSMEFLQRRLLGLAGVAAETVWPGGGASGRTVARGHVGILGMIRTSNQRFEIRGYAGYRPNVADWGDYALEVEAEILHHWLFGEAVMGSVGVSGRVSYWSRPGGAIGRWGPFREKETAYLGGVFRVLFN